MLNNYFCIIGTVPPYDLIEDTMAPLTLYSRCSDIWQRSLNLDRVRTPYTLKKDARHIAKLDGYFLFTHAIYSISDTIKRIS